MNNHAQVEAIFAEHGYADFKWINPQDIVVAQWVRMKCTFGCGEYGHNASCPPNVPSVADCRRFLDEYEAGVIFHFPKHVDDPKDRHVWTKDVNLALQKLERAVFLAGYQKAFLLFMDSCSLCPDCAGERDACKQPRLARPTPEALAIDVFSTVRQYDYPIEVLADYGQTMNRYAILLIE